MLGKYYDLDEHVTGNGIITKANGPHMNLLALRRYCKDQGKQYEELTDEDLGRFTRKPDIRQAL